MTEEIRTGEHSPENPPPPDPTPTPSARVATSCEHSPEKAPPPDRSERLSKWTYIAALARDPVPLLATVYLVLLVVSAVFADLVAPYDPIKQNLRGRLAPPFSADAGGGFIHLLGTDELGRDMLSRVIFGARVSLSVGVLGAVVSGIIGVSLGLVAGYRRGFVEDAIMRLVDGMLALPSLLVALFILFLTGAGFFNLIIVFTLLRWMVYARMTRGLTLSYRELDFVKAARALGNRSVRVMFRHILPNTLSPLLVLATLEVAFLILSEASLSFLGFGIQPPNPSWGLMIANGREWLQQAWWLVTFPGLAILLTALSLNLLANWVRTVTDPVQRWRLLTPSTKPQRRLFRAKALLAERGTGGVETAIPGGPE